MCYARRQRSSWARIKLSKFLYNLAVSAASLPLFRVSLIRGFFVKSFPSLSIKEFSSSVVLPNIFSISFVLLSCCSIFKDRSLPSLSDSLCIISHLLLFVNTFFDKIISFFRILIVHLRQSGDITLLLDKRSRMVYNWQIQYINVRSFTNDR